MREFRVLEQNFGLREDIVQLNALPIEYRETIAAVEIQSRIDITEQFTTITDNIIRADVIKFGIGASLVLGQPNAGLVAIFARKVIFPGGKLETRISTAQPPVEHGNVGSNGGRGASGAANYKTLGHGGAGGDAGRGEDAPSTRQVPVFIFIAAEVQYDYPVYEGSNPVYIEVVGLDGGDGGDGGIGGRGGKGSDGVNGENHCVGDNGSLC